MLETVVGDFPPYILLLRRCAHIFLASAMPSLLATLIIETTTLFEL
jgi:hypothetical protein